MTPNRARTRRILESMTNRWGKPATARDAAQALADAGLLAPDLPEPAENESNGNPSWFNGRVEQDWGEVELHHNGRANGEGETTFTPEEARGLAYALLAASDYAERHRHE